MKLRAPNPNIIEKQQTAPGIHRYLGQNKGVKIADFNFLGIQGKTRPQSPMPAATPSVTSEEHLPQDQMAPWSASPAPAEKKAATQPAPLVLETAPSPSKTPAYSVPTSMAMEQPVTQPSNEPSPFQNPLSACLLSDFERKLAADPKAQDGMAKLSPQQQSQVRGLLGHSSLHDLFHTSGKYSTVSTVENLVGLVSSGRILNKDSQGSTTLDHLVDFQKLTLADKLADKRGVIFSELVANLNSAGETDQRTHGTCSPTSLEYLHAKKEPADYARLVNGLVSEKGEVKFKGGETLHCNDTGLAQDRSGRSNVDRIYQSSMMGHAVKGKALYNNRDDSFYSVAGRYWRGSGLFNSQSSHLMTQIFGKTTRVMEFEGNPKTFEADIKRALNLDQAVWVSLKWDPDPNARDSNHALAIEKWEDGKVHLRNPHGEQEVGDDTGPARSLMGNKGEVVLDQEVFFKHLNSAIRPTRPFYHVWANRVRFLIGGDKGIKQG